MSTDDLCFLPISELSARIADGTLSPLELTRAFLDRIGRLQPTLNAYITIDADAALAAARAAESDIARDGPRSALHGIPLAVKDNVDVAGLPTTCGSRVLAGHLAEHDSTVAGRLVAAGAVMLGKLNMNEFATLVPSEHFGPVINPWNSGHTPGGSSSGSGAAVAAGLCAGALGTDTGGSIRIPATFCGITGLKATHGRISIAGIVPVAWSLDHVGPMTRTVTDAAIMTDVLAAYDPADPVSRDRPWVGAAGGKLESLSDLRIAVADNLLNRGSDPEVITALLAAAAALEDLGAAVDHVQLPELDDAWSIIDPIIAAEANTWHAEYLDRQAQDYGAKVRKFLELGRSLSAQDYIAKRGAKVLFRRRLLERLADYDALIAPGALIPAPPLGARTVPVDGRETAVLPAVVGATAPFNLSGQPSLAVPTGFTTAGLPLGMQIIAHPWQEHVALRIGQAYQTRTRWHVLRPPIEYVALRIGQAYQTRTRWHVLRPPIE